MDLDSASLIRLTAFTADRRNIILIKKNSHSTDASRVLIQTILEVNDRDLGQHEGVEESEAPRLASLALAVTGQVGHIEETASSSTVPPWRAHRQRAGPTENTILRSSDGLTRATSLVGCCMFFYLCVRGGV